MTSDGKAQRVRSEDKARAYRVHVSKRGRGLRLMLWHLPRNILELANVGSKQELVIEVGVPSAAFGFGG